MRNSIRERANPARWRLKRTGDGRDHREGECRSGGSLLADPDRGLIDGDPELVQDAIDKERDWFASEGQVMFRHRSFTGSAATATTRRSFRHASCRCLAATGVFLIGDRLDDLEVDLGTRFDTGNFAGDLGPMPVFAGMTLRPASRCSSLRLVIGIDWIRNGKPPGVLLPTAADHPAIFDPLPQKSDHARPRRDDKSLD